MSFHPAPKPPPREKKPPKPIRAKPRTADEFARIHHSSERVEFVNALPCIVARCEKRSENAHIEGDGMSRKAGYDKIVPCCRGHHQTRTDSLHNLGRESFEGVHYVDLAALALDTERAWRRFAGHAKPERDTSLEAREHSASLIGSVLVIADTFEAMLPRIVSPMTTFERSSYMRLVNRLREVANEAATTTNDAVKDSGYSASIEVCDAALKFLAEKHP